jgi:antitoxin component YwqK of YwqJK toxin-antitoxin module
MVRERTAPIAPSLGFVHNNDVVRLLTVVCILTSITACGSRPSVPQVAPHEPPRALPPRALPPQRPAQAPIAQVAAVDAALPDVPELPHLVCGPGTGIEVGRAPEAGWYCARPDGTRDGPFVTMFPDGTPEVTGSYKDGWLHGGWERHAVTGAIVETGSYAHGQKTGMWRMTSPTGAPLGEYEMHEGTGTEKHWLDDGTLYSERALKAGVANGAERIYAPDGTILLASQWLHGKLDGPRALGTRGTLRIDETFATGVRRGARQIWQQWQLLLDESYDRRGKLDGEYTIWRNKKAMRVHGNYDHGKRDGLWTWSDRDANKERVGNYVDGKRDGPWTEWFENKIVFTGNYTQGKPDGEFIYYDRNENELGRFDIANGTGTMLTFWPNKKIASRQHFSQGAADGVYQELTIRGKVVVEGKFKNDVKHGAWKEWTAEGVPTLEQSWKRGKLDGPVKKFVDGKLATEATYKDGKATGPYIEYRAGRLATTGQFHDDRKTGAWTQYDAEGHATLTASYRDGVLDGVWRQLVDGVVIEGTVTQGRRTGTWTRTDKAGLVRQLTYQTP